MTQSTSRETMRSMTDDRLLASADPPDERTLRAFLAGAAARWDDLVDRLGGGGHGTRTEWRRYSSRSGWVLRVLDGERAIVYLVPRHEWFVASLTLGDEAHSRALTHAGLPDHVVTVLATSRRYAEGWSVLVDVRDEEDAAAVMTLAQIKRGP